MLNTKYTDGSVKVFFLLSHNRQTKPAKVADAKAFQDRHAKFNKDGMVLADGGRPGVKTLFPDSEVNKPTMVLSPGFVIRELNFEADQYERAIDEAKNK